MRFLLLSALLLVGACTSTRTADNVTVVWNRVDDTQATCQNLAGRKEIFAIRGCSKWGDTDKAGSRSCQIYAPEPKDERDLQAFATLGHELMHCFDGNWHDRWGRMDDAQAAAGRARRSPPATAAD
ncbi:MAG TPA: hypothetical protein VIV54_07805 [Burkholderiales bacterium]